MIRLSNLIAPSFYSLFWDLENNKHTHYWLKGGRGSTKSSFISIEIILGIMRFPSSNAVILRKVANTLRESVFQQLLWAIDSLGVSHLWKDTVSPLELCYIPTGQKIIFRGADDPKKIKSTKFKNGYCRYIWFEELDEFNGMDEIRVINQSLMRGGKFFTAFYSYNPPKSQKNWVNEEIIHNRNDRLVHHSTYISVPKPWLGDQFFIEAEHLKNLRPQAYNHEYLGEVTGTGGEVFTNVTIRNISNEEIKSFDKISRGIDWGYAIDPFAYTVNHYDSKRKRLYIFFEIYAVNMTNTKAAKLVKLENINNNIIICDSAEPKSIAEFNSYGIRVTGAKKGPDSIEYGIKWLQDLQEIIIDSERCPNTAREFINYELEKDKNGNFKASYPDKDNHIIDAVRYSLENKMRNVRIT